jgi:glycosyltransferase involved in cell wall biosynthesis
MNRDIRIALVSAADPRDRRTWSGSTFFMARALENHVGHVDYIGPLTIPGHKFKEGLSRLKYNIFGTRTYPARNRGAAKFFSEEIKRRLSDRKYDLVFAPAASIEIALLDTDLPIIYASDATFSLIRNVYPIFSAMSRSGIEEEEFIEQSAIRRSSLLLYPSEWAARSAVSDYGAENDRVRVIPFGANLDNEPDRGAVVGKKITGAVKILFLAKEWNRKGGATAVNTLNALLDMGIDAQLTVCGVTPPANFSHDKAVVIPYLDKNIPDERERFEQILKASNILLLPTEVECYGIVFCEANAYGMPVFAKRVGGIPTIVKDGENGYLLPPGATGENFADSIAKSIADAETYSALNIGARNRYEAVLNWSAWGREVGKVVREKLIHNSGTNPRV